MGFTLFSSEMCRGASKSTSHPQIMKCSSFFPLGWITGLISRRPIFLDHGSWNRVQHYGRIERGDGSNSFIMHHRKPVAVSPGSQRRSEGAQSSSGLISMEHAVPSALRFATKSQWKTFEVLTTFCGLHMILQFKESRSAVTQILQFEEKSPKKRVLVLRSWIRYLYT